MSFRVRFSQETPDVAYLPSQKKAPSLADELFTLPMPPLHAEKNFEMDIHTAASIGEAKIIKELLKSGSSVNKTNRTGWFPLLYAAYLGHSEACTLLIENGAQVDATNSLGQTALMLASACGNSTVVKILLSKGASGSRSDREKRTSLHYAASCSQNLVVDSLLQTGCDPNAKDMNGMTPVLEACQAAHELTLTSLLEQGGDPYLKNNRGEDGEILASETPKVLQLIKNHKKKEMSGAVIEPSKARQTETLADLMEAMKLERYLPRFEQEKIDLQLFFSLTDKDLEEMGVAYGPKKRMLSVIDRYRNTGVIHVDMPLPAAPPAYNDIVSESRGTASDPGHGGIGFSRSILESTQLLAMEAIEALSHDETSERLRPLLNGIKDGLQQAMTRISRV